MSPRHTRTSTLHLPTERRTIQCGPTQGTSGLPRHWQDQIPFLPMLMPCPPLPPWLPPLPSVRSVSADARRHRVLTCLQCRFAPLSTAASRRHTPASCALSLPHRSAAPCLDLAAWHPCPSLRLRSRGSPHLACLVALFDRPQRSPAPWRSWAVVVVELRRVSRPPKRRCGTSQPACVHPRSCLASAPQRLLFQQLRCPENSTAHVPSGDSDPL